MSLKYCGVFRTERLDSRPGGLGLFAFDVAGESRIVIKPNHMLRKSFLMTLKPGASFEYEQRHNPIWPELQDVLRKHGVQNYSIFIDRSDNQRLFGYAEIESEELWRRIGENDTCRRWWNYMKDLMLTNDDASPVAIDLVEVFHLE